MKREYSPILFACGVVVIIACLCVFGAAASIISLRDGLFDLFRREPQGPLTLYTAIERGVDRSLTLDCVYSALDGSIVSSQPLEGGGFAADLTPEEAEPYVDSWFQDARFYTQDGSVFFRDGEPVQASLEGGGRVALLLSREESAGDLVRSISLGANVQGEIAHGTFAWQESLSTVEQGVGVTQEVQVSAQVNCRVLWLDTMEEGE